MEFNKLVKKHHWYTSFWADIAWVMLGIVALLFIFGAQYATGELGYSASVKKQQIKSGDSVFIEFDQTVAASAVEKNFKISPDAKVSFSWSNNFRKLEVKPDVAFEEGKKYILSVDPQNNFAVSQLLGKNIEPIELAFEVEVAPKVVSISPESGTPDAKIDSAVKISFDRSTVGYDVNFVVEPFSNFYLSYDESRKDFTILPKGNLDFARDYAVSVRLASNAAKLSDAQMPEIFRANFKTELSPPPPPKIEEVVLPEDIKAGIIADSQVATPDAKISEGKYIDINLAKQQLSIFEDGERLGTYKVSTGKRGMATPTGTFKVMSKSGRAWSRKYNLYMPYWMQFTGAGHGIHELPEWKNGYKEGANHLGTPVSHGCVRLGVGPAAKVYDWSEVGTAVVIHY